MNTTAAGNLVYLAVSGITQIAVFPGSGTIVSTDGGQNWSVNNPTNPAVQLNYVLQHNGSIFGILNGAGVYKFNTSTGIWENSSKGLPDALSFQFAKVLYSYGNTLFYVAIGFLDAKPVIFSSTDDGATWSSVSNSGLGTVNGAMLTTALAATPSNLYLYDYKSQGSLAFLYQMPNTISTIEIGNELPKQFKLSQNYPNPFNPSTTIKWQLAANSVVTLKIYDVLGKEVATLVNNELEAGSHSVNFDASHLSSGIYFYTLKAGSFIQTKKMLLIK